MVWMHGAKPVHLNIGIVTIWKMPKHLRNMLLNSAKPNLMRTANICDNGDQKTAKSAANITVSGAAKILLPLKRWLDELIANVVRICSMPPALLLTKILNTSLKSRKDSVSGVPNRCP